MNAVILLLAVAALSHTAPAASAETPSQPTTSAPTARAPTGGWVVDFDAAQCVATRNYGTESEPLIFALKAPAVGDVMQVVVIRNGRGGVFANQLEGKIGIGGAKPFATSMLAAMTEQKPRRLYRANLPLQQFSTIRDASTISIEGGDEFKETLAISQMSPLLKVMNDCVADLRKVWNVEEGDALSAALRQRARGNLARVLMSEDYPDIAMEKDASGMVEVVVLIDEAGRIADCTVTQTSGIAALDAQSCAKFKQRARFKPAVGIDGKPAKDVLRTKVRWILPDD